MSEYLSAYDSGKFARIILEVHLNAPVEGTDYTFEERAARDAAFLEVLHAVNALGK